MFQSKAYKSPKTQHLGSATTKREPISIFRQIEGVQEKQKEELKRLLEKLKKVLPGGFKIGAAVSSGDCFFDSVAQRLNELKSKDLIISSKNFNVKSLREDCANSAGKYKDEIIKDANVGNYFVPQKNTAFPGLGNIQNERGNDVPDEQKTFDRYLGSVKETAEEGNYSIWGRSEIEGKMISNKYDVVLHFYSMNEEDGLKITVTEFTPGDNDPKVFIEGEDLDQLQIDSNKKVVGIVGYKKHFVPLLSNIEKDIEESKEVPRKEVYGNVVNSNLENILLYSRETSSLQNIGNSLPCKQSSMFHARGPDKENRPSEDVSPSKFISETLDKENYTEWLKQEDIARIANLQYGWHGEDNNIIFDIIGSLEQLESQLKEYQEKLKRPNKQSLTYIINLSNYHWVTLVITYHNQQFLAYYIDSFGKSAEEGYKDLLEQKNINIRSFSINQQSDGHNCAIFALENAKIINESIQSNEIDNLEKKLQDLGRELSTQQLMDIRQSFVNLLKENSENLPSNCQLNDQMCILSSNALEEEDHVIRMLVSFLGSNTQEKPSIDNFKIGTVAQDCLLDAIAQGLNELRNEGIIEHSSEFSIESLQEVCEDMDERHGNYEYENYAEESDPVANMDNRTVCDKYGVDLCIYSIKNDNEIEVIMVKANSCNAPCFSYMRKDSEEFQIDNPKTIRIVKYDQYFVPFFSNKPKYVQALELAKLLLNNPDEFNKRFNDILKGVLDTPSHERQIFHIRSFINEILTIYRTELHETIKIKREVCSQILDDRGGVSIKVELSFVIKEGKEITRIINIIQQTEGFSANVSEEVLCSKSNNQSSTEIREISTPLEIVIPTVTCASGNDGQAWYGAGGILNICNSDSVDSNDSEIKEELLNYKLKRLSLNSIVKKEGNNFKVTLQFNRIPTGKEGNHVIPVSTFLSCIVNLFNVSENCFEAVENLLSIFSKAKQFEKHRTYVKRSYEELKEGIKELKFSQLKESLKENCIFSQLKEFSGDTLIPFVFLSWNERETSVYDQLRTQSNLGAEGVKVRLVNEKFKKLLSSVPSNLKEFEENMETIRDEFFGVLDIPTIVKIDPTDRRKLDQYSNDILKYLKPRINAMLDYLSTMVESDFLKQIKNSLISDSGEAMSAFHQVQKLIKKQFNERTYDNILKKCKKIEECCKDPQVQQYLEKFKITQEFKYQLKQLSNNTIKYNKEYDFPQSLNKIIGYCQDGKIKNDLSILESYLAAIPQVLKNLGNEVYFTKIIDDINTVAKKDLDTIIYDIRKLFQAWIYILELKKPYDYHKKEDYFRFLNRFFNKSNFLHKLIDNKPDINDRLSKLVEMILKEVDNQSESSFDYGIQASIIGRPGSSTFDVPDIPNDPDVSKIIMKNLRKGCDIYNGLFISIVLQHRTRKFFEVVIGTADEEKELKERSMVKSEQQDAPNYLAIIKNKEGYFIKYIEKGELYDSPCCNKESTIKRIENEKLYLSPYQRDNENMINLIVRNIEERKKDGTSLSSIAMIDSPSLPIPKHEDCAIVLSPYEKPFIHYVAEHYLAFHKEIGDSKKNNVSCIHKCDSILTKPFRDLYNEHSSSRDISKKLVNDSEHDNANKSDNINVDSCLDNSPQNIANVPRNLNVNCGTSDDHLKQQENNFEHLDDGVGLSDSKGTNIFTRIDLFDKKSVDDYLKQQESYTQEESNFGHGNINEENDVDTSNSSSEQESSAEHNDTSEKSTNEDMISLGIKRLRVSDGSTQKPPVKKVTLDDSLRQNVEVGKSVGDYQKEAVSDEQQSASKKRDLDDGNNSKKQGRGFKSTSDLPGNSNDCGSKGSSLHNSEKVLEEDLLLSLGSSNDGNDLHDSAQGFNEDLLLFSNDSENESSLHHQAQNSNNESVNETNYPTMVVSHISPRSGAQIDSDNRSYDDLPGQNVEHEFISQNDEEKRNSLSGQENSSDEGSILSSPDKKRPRIDDEDTQKLPNVKEVEVESNVGSDKSYEQQDSNRESGSEISGSRSNSPDSQEGEQPTLNDVSDENSGDKRSVCGSPEQNSSGPLEQVNNSSERNDLQNISLQNDASEEERDSSDKSQSNDFKQNDDISDESSSKGSLGNSGENYGDTSPLSSSRIIGIQRSLEKSCGNTRLHRATLKGSRYCIVKRFLDEGDDIDSMDGEGRTPLHWAYIMNTVNTANLLLKMGADPKIRDNHNRIQSQYKHNSNNICEGAYAIKEDVIKQDVEGVEVESNVGSDKSYEQQAAIRESNSEESDLRSSSTASNDINDESSDDEGNIYSSPGQNSGSPLEQASNFSERNDLQNISLQDDASEEERGSSDKSQSNDSKQSGDISRENDISGSVLSPTGSPCNFYPLFGFSIWMFDADIFRVVNSNPVSIIITAKDTFIQNSMHHLIRGIPDHILCCIDGKSGLIIQFNNKNINSLILKACELAKADTDSRLYYRYAKHCVLMHDSLRGEHNTIRTANENPVLNFSNSCIIDLFIVNNSTLMEVNNTFLLALDSDSIDWGAVKSLIEQGANPDIRNSAGTTTLSLAVSHGNLDMVKFLVQAGANINARSGSGDTPLDLARKQKNQEMTKILEEKNAQLCHDYPEVLETRLPGATLSNVALDNQSRRKSAPF